MNFTESGNSEIRKELEAALKIVASSINQCEKIHPKFAVGTSQHTLLKNRIKALHISKSLLLEEPDVANYTKEELIAALAPVSSIIRKCEKAKQKFDEGTVHYTRFQNMINAMVLADASIREEISKRSK